MRRIPVSVALGVLIMSGLSACASRQTADTEKYLPAVKQDAVPAPAPPQSIPTANASAASATGDGHDGMSGRIVEMKPVAVGSKAKDIAKGGTAAEQAVKDSTEDQLSTQYHNAVLGFRYDPTLIYKIYTAPRHLTVINFQEGENIESVAGGDTSNWSIQKTFSGANEDNDLIEHLLVKPYNYGMTNTVFVTTDKRTYYLMLVSPDESDTAVYNPIIKWNYPQTAEQRAAADDGYSLTHPGSDPACDTNLNRINTNYHLTIESKTPPPWLPTLVFTTGDKTYIQFPYRLSNVNSPVLFVSSGTGKNVSPALVNYRAVWCANTQQYYYVVDKFLLSAQLRLGGKKESGHDVVQINYVGSTNGAL